MKRMVFAVALLGCAVGWCQPTESLTTATLHNGYFWQLLSDNSKLVFVAGMVEGLLWGGGKEGPASGGGYFKKVKFGEIVAGFDQVYADPANRPIPIVMAVQILATKTNQSLAWNDPVITTLVARLRTEAATATASKENGHQ